MAAEAKVIHDSVNTAGERITTMQLRFPRIILAEFNTHRAFSRNASSSRAIPISSMIEKVSKDPFVPSRWPQDCKGMSNAEWLVGSGAYYARRTWEQALHDAVSQVNELIRLGVHKQIANRLLEPWMWSSVVVTATDWDNFFSLRCSADAQPEMQELAVMMQKAMEESIPKTRTEHIPYLRMSETAYDWYTKAQISAARCARVSYLKHDGTEPDMMEDLKLAGKLLESKHMSPFEHQAFVKKGFKIANFRGWHSFRSALEFGKP